jgi:hypothetical protein
MKAMILAALTSVGLLLSPGAAGSTRAPVPGAIDPAVTQGTIQQTVCRLGYTRTVRPPQDWSHAVKERLLVEQRLPGRIQDYELDHLIPLGLGGAPRDPANLWLQPWPEARQKDEEEVDLHAAVCSGRLTLEEAQQRMQGEWGRP